MATSRYNQYYPFGWIAPLFDFGLGAAGDPSAPSVLCTDPNPVFCDGFESGDTSFWNCGVPGSCVEDPTFERYTGKDLDTALGLYDFDARYYDARIGRFITPDPGRWSMENPQSFNRYTYALNSPYKYRDPDGEVVDTILDVGFIAYDAFDIGRSLFRGEGVSGTQWAALGADVVGAVIPFATGGGAAIRAAAHADDALHAIETGVRATERAGEVARGGTYVLKNGETIMRSGRTNNLARRAGEHARATGTAGLDFEAIHYTDDYATQRGLEQMLHDTHNPPLDKLNPISPRNQKRSIYMEAARQHLKKAGEPR